MRRAEKPNTKHNTPKNPEELKGPENQEEEVLAIDAGDNVGLESGPRVIDREEEFGMRLNELKAAILEMEKHNKECGYGPKEEISEEMFKNIMDMTVEEFMKMANGGENINKPDLRSVHDQVSGVIFGEFNEEHKLNWFKRLLNTGPGKVAFAALCLFLKFGVPTQAHEATVKENHEHENKIENLDGGGKTPPLGDGKMAYQLDPKEVAVETLKEVSTLDISQSFETDKADISPADSLAITNQIHNFLDKINNDNVKDFLNTEKVALVSSDERATKFGAEDKKAAPTLEGNTPLSRARADKIIKITKAAFESHNYAKAKFPPDVIKGLKNIKIVPKIPDKGYTKITELNKINPETGKAYTEADVEKMKPNEKALLLNECRYAKIDFMVESETQLKKYDQFDHMYVYIDKSPSSKYAMNGMSDNLADMGLEKNAKGNYTKVDLVYYATDINEIAVKHFTNIQEAAKDLKTQKTNGAGLAEAPFAACITHLNGIINENLVKAHKGEKIDENNGAVFEFTEGMQDVKNLYKAIDLMEKAHVGVKEGNALIRMYNPQDSHHPLEIKVIDLKNRIEEAIKLRIASGLPALQAKIEFNEKNLQIRLNHVADQLKPNLLKEILHLEKISDLGTKEEIKAKLMKGYSYDQTHWARSHNAESNTLSAFGGAKKGLADAKANLVFWQTMTVEKYLSIMKVQITTITDEKGEKKIFGISDPTADIDLVL